MINTVKGGDFVMTVQNPARREVAGSTPGYYLYNILYQRLRHANIPFLYHDCNYMNNSCKSFTGFGRFLSVIQKFKDSRIQLFKDAFGADVSSVLQSLPAGLVPITIGTARPPGWIHHRGPVIYP